MGQQVYLLSKLNLLIGVENSSFNKLKIVL